MGGESDTGQLFLFTGLVLAKSEILIKSFFRQVLPL